MTVECSCMTKFEQITADAPPFSSTRQLRPPRPSILPFSNHNILRRDMGKQQKLSEFCANIVKRRQNSAHKITYAITEPTSFPYFVQLYGYIPSSIRVKLIFSSFSSQKLGPLKFPVEKNLSFRRKYS